MTTSVQAPAASPPPPPPLPSATPPADAPRRLRLTAVVVLAVLVAALVLGIAPRVGRQKQVAAVVAENTAVPTVSVTTVQPATGASTTSLPGTLTPIETAPIFARATGYISRLPVNIGSRVRQGDLLAQIEAPELDHQVEAARAMLAQTRATHGLAQANLGRYRTMWADSTVTAQEVDSVQAGFGVASANVNNAAATLRQLMQLQRYERVVAPFSGVVTARNINLGAFVGTAGAVTGSLPSGAGSTTGSLFELARIDTLAVYVTVPENFVSGVKVGNAAVVTATALVGDTLRGRVARTANSLDPTARTLVTEVDVANPSGTFLPNMYAQVDLSLEGAKQALHVPATALVIRDGPPQVVTVGPDSTVRYATVTIGRDYGSWVEATGGLATGAKIVVNPPDDLKAGQRVRVARGTQ
jgi:membrane fusion protein (multidrug efflux system)